MATNPTANWKAKRQRAARRNRRQRDRFATDLRVLEVRMQNFRSAIEAQVAHRAALTPDERMADAVRAVMRPFENVVRDGMAAMGVMLAPGIAKGITHDQQ